MIFRQTYRWLTLPVLLLGLAGHAFAEGSANLLLNGGNRAYLDYRDETTTDTPVLRKTIVKVYANVGEKISLGSSAKDLGNGAISWSAPDGTTGTAPTGAAGTITNLAQEVAGPLPNAGGYNPYIITVGAGQGGIWLINFVSPDETSLVDPPPQLTSYAWTQANDQPNNVSYVIAWDATVRTSGGTAKTGRVYVNQLAMNLGANGLSLNSQIYVLTSDGYRYQVNYNGVDPYGFNMFVNNQGFLSNGVASYLSVNEPISAAQVQNPDSPDTATAITHKIFFNTPDSSMPSTANLPSGSTWLYTTPIAPTITSLTFVGVDGTTNQLGSGLGGSFKFTANVAGSYFIAIDLDGNGIYTNPVDRLLAGQTVAGANSVFWDGNNGLGQPAAPLTNGASVSAQVYLAGGEVHFPYLDAENNPNGIIIERLNGAGAPNYTIFYNDTGFAGGGSALPITGQSSVSGGHSWNSNFGNNRGMDTWTYLFGNVSTPPPLIIRQADLEVVSKTNNVVPVPGGSVNYTVVLRDNGPEAVTNATVVDSFSSALTHLVLVSTNFTKGGSLYSSSFTTSNFNASVNINSGEVATLVFSAIVSPSVTGTVLNVVDFLSSADVGDTNDLLRTGAGNNNKTNTFTLLPAVADLAITKSGTNSVGANSNLVYSITVTNLGPSSATSLVVTDALPPGVTFQSASANGTTNATGAVFWGPISTFAPGLSTNFSVTVKAPGNGILTNVAVVGSAATDTNTANNTSAPVITTISSLADLRLTKTAAPTVPATSNLVYTIIVTNAGPSLATSLVVTDNLPATATFVSAVPPATTNASNKVIWSSLGNLAAGSITNLSLTVKAPPTGVLTNTAVAVSATPDPGSTNNTSPLVISTVTELANLAVTKTGPPSVNATNQVTYTIAVTNNGPSTATSVVVTDSLPANVIFLSATGGGLTNGSLTNVFWSLPALTAGVVTNFGVTVRAPATGIITNSALAGSTTTDPTPGNNISAPAITTVTPQADLAVIKTGPPNVNATNNITYTITVTNQGPSAATSMVVTDTLPALVTFVSATGGGTTNASGAVFWPVIANFPNGASTNLSLIVKAPANGIVTNTAITGSAVSDPALTNNTSAPVITTISPQASLAITKIGPPSVNATNNITYTITVTNQGPSAATSMVVTDTLPALVTFVSATGGGTTNASGAVFWPVIANFPNGASTNLSLIVKAPANGIVTNTAITGSAVSDPTPGNNTSAPVITTISPQADLAITKTGPPSVNATNNITYTITITNQGPSAATSLVVTDALPALVTFVSATGGGTTNASGAVFWPAIANFPNGASTNLSLIVKAPASGIVTNTAVVGSPVSDPIPGNNTSTPVITTVSPQADLSIIKNAPATVKPLNNITYVILITNLGPSTATSVVVTDAIPSNVIFKSSTGGATTNALGVVFWPPITLLSGAGTNYSLTVTAPANGVVTNVAVIGSPVADPAPGNNTSAPATTTVTPEADLAITKTGPPTANAGNNITYTITVTNEGPSIAVNMVATDALPASVTFVSATGGGTTNASGAVFWPPIASFINGATTNLTLIVKAPASGIVTNTAITGSDVDDPTPGNNTSTPVITTISPQADLAVTKTGPPSVNAANNITYTITVTNQGPSTATSMVVTDALPAGVTFVSATGGGITNASGAVFWPPIASFINGASTNLTLVVKAPASGIVTNTATVGSPVTDPTPANNTSAPVTTTVSPQADLAITKTGPPSVNAANNITYTITVTNQGPSTATSMVVTDSLPTGVTFVSATGGGTTNASGNVFWPAIANFPNGASTNLSLIVKAPASGTVTNTAIVGSPVPDPTPANNTSAPVITLINAQADLSVTKVGPPTVNAANNIVYTLTVANAGPSVATSVVVTDALPANVTFISATGGGTTNASGAVYWPTIPSLTNGATTNLSVTVLAPAGGAVTNTATVGSPIPDPTPGNNTSAPVITLINAQADLSVTKIGPPTVNAANNIVYTLTIANAGPSAATSVVVTDALPANVTFISATGGGTTNASGAVYWPTIPALTNGASTNLSVTVLAPAGGAVTNIATVGSPIPDPTPANNTSAPVITLINAQADLSVTKIGPPTVNAANNIVYTLTVANAGPSAATSVVVTDALPANVTFISATGGGTTNASGAVYWPTIPSLTNGASTNLSVTVLAPAGGAVTNIATVGSPIPDPTPANNTSAPVITLINAQADLSVTKIGPPTVNAANNIVYTLTIANAGPSAATSVVVTDALPANVTFISATGGGTTNASGAVYWPTIPSLTNGASTNLSVTVLAPAGGAVTNTATVGSPIPDPTPANNTSVPVITLINAQADLSVTKIGPPTVNAASDIIYTLTVANAGPSPATSVVVTDALPANVTFISATGGGTTNASGAVYWPTIPSLTNGASTNLSVTVLAPAGGAVTNTAIVGSPVPDPTPANNTSVPVITLINAQADLSVTKIGPPTVNAASDIIYTLTVANAGPSPATSVVVTDALPANVTFISATGGGTTNASGAVYWPTIPSLTNGASTNLSVTVLAPAGGAVTNTATVGSPVPDPTPANNTSAPVITLINAQADLSVTKIGPPTVNAANNIVYTLTLANAGPSAATSVVVTDALPANVTFISATGGGTTNASGNVFWPVIPSLTNGASTNLSVTVLAPAGGIVTNTATVGSPVSDPTPANNTSAPVITLINAQADLSVTKVGPPTVNAANNIVYTLTVANAGPSAATSVVVTDALPANVTFISATGGGTTNASGAVYWPTIPSLTNGASTNLSVTVLAPAGGAVTNTATVGSPIPDPTPANNTSVPVITLINAQADLSVTKIGPPTVNAANNIVYTLTVANAGPSAATSVVVTDALPANVTFISATGGGTTNASGAVFWPVIPALTNGASTNLSVTVLAPAGGAVTNTATVGSPIPDPTPANNTSVPVITLINAQADLSVTKVGPPTVNAANNIVYTLTVANAGPSAATSVVVTDALPANVTFISATGGGTTNASGAVYWPTIPSLTNGASTNLSVTVLAPAGGAVTNTATVGSPVPDPTPANNTSVPVITLINAQADLSVTKIGPPTVNAASDITYTLTVANAGPSAATSVVVTDALPANVTFISATGGGTTNASGAVYWPTIPALTNGATTNLSVTVLAPAGGAVTNTATVGSPIPDPTPANNTSAPVITLINAQADLSVTKAGPPTVNAANNIVYTLTVANAGPSAATSVVVTDALPANVTFISATGGGTTNASGAVYWPTIPALTNGASTNLSVTVLAPAGGAVTNIATVGSPIPDPTPANNTSAPVITLINAQADLSVTKAGPPTVNAANNIVYTLIVANAGPSAATSVVVTDALPANVTFISATGGGTTNASGAVYWPTIPALTNGATTNLSVTVLAPAGGAVTNTATVGSPVPDPTPANNTSAPVITLINAQADLSVTKIGPPTVNAANNIVYTLTIANAGPSAATSVVVTDALPANVTFISATGGGTTNASGAVYWPTIPALTNGASTNLSVTVLAPAGGAVTNIATVGSPIPDPTPANNTSAPVITLINAQADLSVTKAGPPTVNAANNIVYTLIVANAGPSAATSVVVTDALPANVTFISATGGGTTNASGAVYWPTIPALTNGASTNLSVTVLAPAGGAVTNTATVGSPIPDPTPANNTSVPVITLINAQADLSVTKVGPPTVNAANNIVYTLTIANAGPSAATSVVVTDALPANVTFISATGGGTTNASGAVYWPVIPSLTNGASTNLSVTVLAPAGGAVTNTATVGSPIPDPTPANNTSVPVITLINAQADLSVTKIGPPTVNAASDITYTLTVANAGPSAATSVVVTDALPANVTFISATGGGTTNASGAVYWPTIPALTNGASTNLSVTVLAPAGGAVTNTATVGSPVPDPTPANNTSVPVITLINAQADLSVTKIGPPTVNAASDITYTLTVANAGPSAAISVVVTDALPANVTFISATGGGTTNASGAVYWPTIPALTNGASTNLSVTVLAPAGGAVTNTATVGSPIPDPTPANNTSVPVITLINAQADLSVTKIGPPTVNAASDIIYTLTVANAGPSPATSVVVTDALPANVTFISATGGGTTNASGAVYWPTIPSLTNGASTNLSVTVLAPAGGAVTNTATVGSPVPDPTPANNTSAPVITLINAQADLSVTKIGPPTVNAANNIVYTLTIANAGPSAATSVVVTDALPANVTFISATGGGTTNASGAVYWPTIPSLTNGASTNLSVTVLAPAGGAVTNTATVGSPIPDPTPANNTSAPVITLINAQADLSVTKIGPPTVNAANNIVYTLTIANAGPSAATSVVVTDALPANVTFISATGGGTTNTSGAVYWPTIPSLTNGASTNLSVTVLAPAGGAVTNTATVGSPIPDPTPANNTSAPVITLINAQADLSVTKIGPPTVNAASDIIYTLTVANAGPSPATSVVVTDALPANVTFISATGGGTTNASGAVYWPTIPSLTNGASTNLSVTVLAPAGGAVTNIATVGSPIPDPTPANNTSVPVITLINAQADLSVTKAGPPTVNAANNIVYTLTIANAGPSAATSVVVTDALPGNVTFISATGGGTTNASGAVYWPTIPSLTNGASTNLSVTVLAPAGGAVTNTATVGSPIPDPTPANNTSAPVITLINAQADLSVTKIGPPTINAANNIVYTLTIANAGPSAATSVVVTDALPANVTFISATGGGTTNASGNVFWPVIPSLTNGASTNLSVTVLAPAGGAVTNTATVGSPIPDPTPANNTSAPVITLINAQADLSVTKVGPPTVNAASDITYTLTVANAGPSAATSVVVTDALPANVTFISATGGGTTNASGNVFWPVIPSLTNGASTNLSVTVLAPAGGAVTNTATVGSPVSDPTPANNTSAPVITLINAQADLSVTKVGPPTVNAANNIVYTLTVANAGPSAATSVVVTDALPANVTFISATGGGTTNTSGAVYWPTIPSLTNGASTNLSVTVLAPAGGAVTNTATVGSPIPDPTPANNTSAPVITLINAQADLSVTKIGPPTVNAANNIVYTLTVANAGPSAATSVVVTDALPANVTFISATGGGTTNASGAVFWPTIPSLTNGASTNLSVTVLAPAGGAVTNTATVGSPIPDPTPANNTSAPVITLINAQADLSVTKVGPPTVNAASDITYTLTVANAGPSAATSVVVTDALPANVTFISATGGGTTNASGNVFWPVIPSLTNGASTNLSVTVLAPAGGAVTNTATVGSPIPDPTPANNTSAPVITLINAQADLSVTKVGPPTVNAASDITYTLTVANAGPSAATSVVVTDALPANVTFISATGGGTTNASGNVFWPVIPSLTNGASTNLSVTVLAPAGGAVTNTATVGSPIPDPTPANNTSAPVITLINAQADLSVTKVGPPTVNAASDIVYTLTVANAGPSAATSVVVTDALPANVTFISATGGGTTNASGAVYWPTIPSLTNGATTNLSVTVLAPAGGAVTNTATVGSPIPDPTPANNTSAPVITLINAQADLSVTKIGPPTVNAASDITYTLTVANAGPSAATSVVVTDALPANVTFISATGGGTTNASGAVYWPTIPSLTNGASTNLSVTVLAPAGGAVTNTATVGSPIPDPTPANNTSAPVITLINAQADLSVTKVGPPTVNAANNITYTIMVTNAGPAGATSVVVTDALPANVTFVSATSGGTTNTSGAVFWPTIPNFANGATTNLRVTVKAPLSGAVTNMATVGSASPDPVPGNNTSAPVITLINVAADLSVTKTGPASVNAGNNITYTIKVANAGPSAATSVVVTDALPANVTFVSATGGGTTNASGAVYWPTIASFTNGAATNLSVTVKAPSSGAITNTATVGSVTPDPTPGNNTSAPVITLISGDADLSVTKTGPASVNAGNNITYTITVANAGPSAATSVVVTDALPANVTFVSATGGGTTNASGAVFWPTILNFANGAITNLSVTVKAPLSGAVTNIAVAGSTTPDPTPGNNTSAPVITLINAQADLAVSKTGPASVIVGSNVIYTITLTNMGPSAASSVAVTDSLPANVTFVSASGGGTVNGNGAVSWPTIASLPNGGSATFTVTAAANSIGTITNRVSCGSATPDPDPSNNNGTSPSAIVITTVNGFNVLGYVYNDANKNSAKDNGESGTGLILYTKLIGAVTNVATVDPTTGAYTFTNVPPGTYTIVVSTNNSLANLTASIPAGWVGTEAPNQTRLNVVVLDFNLPNQNFGLYSGARLSGTVFVDNGTGGGNANDGVRNGGETGLPGITVKLTDATGVTVYDTEVTDGAGNYSLLVPANSGTLKVMPIIPTGYLATGATLANLPGAQYSRNTSTITFTNVIGASFSGINFGVVPVNTFIPDNQSTALPGTFVYYSHTFVAGSAGSLTLTNTHTASPNVAGWISTLYIDGNCNGAIDGSDAPYSGPISVTASQRVCVIVKEFVPANAPVGAEDTVAITANFDYTGASPALNSSLTHNDVTTVGVAGTAGLTLTKIVDKATALPGETITYTITYANTSSGLLTNIVIHDQTPAFTTFSAGSYATPLPTSVSAITVNAPGVGATGSITWQLTGSLDPGKSGIVTFSVTIAP